jgi:hypothetical protein
MTAVAFPPDYGAPWDANLKSWRGKQDPFVEANVVKYMQILTRKESGPRMVVNIGGWSLEKFLLSGRHLNRYELHRMGAAREPAQKRLRVDGWISSPSLRPEVIHFGAVALESSGVRFYGEYCLVLKTVDEGTQIMDRDSYELDEAPLVSSMRPASAFSSLRGTWGRDLVAMAVLRARDVLLASDRAVTEGRLRESLLRGEEFIEVHKADGFGPSDLEEVRIPPCDVAAQTEIVSSTAHGSMPSIAEIVWFARRARLNRALAQAGLEIRVVDAPVVR